MAFIKAHCHRELPKTGYLVCTDKVDLTGPLCVDISSALYLLEDLDKFIPSNEWLVVEEWEHAFFIHTMKRINGRMQARACCRDNGWVTFYDCKNKKVEFIDQVWKGNRHDRQH